jgi:hypothetical protein
MGLRFCSYRTEFMAIQRRMEDNKHANGLSIIIGCDLYSTYSIYLYMHTGVLRIALYYTDLQGVCQKEKKQTKT